MNMIFVFLTLECFAESDYLQLSSYLLNYSSGMADPSLWPQESVYLFLSKRVYTSSVILTWYSWLSLACFHHEKFFSFTYDNFTEYSFLEWQLSSRVWSTTFQAVLKTFLLRKSAVIPMGLPLHMTWCFSLVSFNIFCSNNLMFWL